MNDQELKKYYRAALQGDVCTVTEADFVAEAKDLAKQGYSIALKEFKGIPTSVRIDRAGIIRQAQEIGQRTFQSIAIIERS